VRLPFFKLLTESEYRYSTDQTRTYYSDPNDNQYIIREDPYEFIGNLSDDQFNKINTIIQESGPYYGFIMKGEKAPFINLKTLEYSPFNPILIPKYKQFDERDAALANVLIEFMNMQTLATRIELAKVLTELTKRNKNGSIPYITFQYTTADNSSEPNKAFYAFDIVTFIDNNRVKDESKKDVLDIFLNAMKIVREKTDIKYKGFVLNSMNRGSKSSYTGKNIKYKGMINCCINDDNNCTNKEKGFLFGTRRKKDPKLCKYPDTSSSRSNPVPRTIFSGGRRRTRHKRTRRTRR
jgi:hypothetical protein